jgi:hypothetical protein
MKNCPYCGQSGVHRVVIPQLKSGEMHLCQECDALWDTGKLVEANNFEEFSTYMEKHRLKGDWSYVKKLD